ncbi:atypical/TAF1 protein kinase [Flagelloscypha sp. PMI_526]|nr:atypical/TAF1 protein kinase [Flagelloscypha sp. PMI_526]
MSSNEETEALRGLTGFGLDHVLGELELPAGSSRLGMGGALAGLAQAQFFGQGIADDDEDAVGLDQGVDYEDQVDLELGDEEDYDDSQPYTMSYAGPQKRVRVVKKLRPRPKSVYERFPDFKKEAILNFSELFKGNAVAKSRVLKRPVQIELVYPRRKEPLRNFLTSIVGANQKQVEDKRAAEVVSAANIDLDLRAAIEDQIIYGPEQLPPVSTVDNSLTTPKNKAFESGAWTQSIIWSPTAPFRDFTQIEFNHEDDIVPEERSTIIGRPRKRQRLDTGPAKDRFNLSNDQFYEVAKDGGRHRVRQTFGQLSVDHSYPAQKLQLPFFKTRLNKQEARAFHRPALQFPHNVEIKFTKVRTAKKKKDKTGRSVVKGGNVAEGLHRPGDINFVLWEFSEEHPPIIQNFGMGSSLVNYYRKKDDKDEHVPKYDLGVPFVLEPQDDGPFMRFGFSIYNNLTRAPLFRHKPQPTDFLVIRHTLKGEAKYYIRDIRHLFVVGQTYPVTEVPGPHSRKITNTVKHRLQVIAFKLLRKSKEERLKISSINEMRQRLKYHRRGDHQGFWRLKEGWAIPTDAEMLKMVTPEQVRHLQDSADELKLPIEQQLAPWITTKTSSMLASRRPCEAFSFIRISMKDIFVKAGENYEQKLAEAENRPKSAHRYNVAEQQQIYKAQFNSLSKKEPPQLTAEDEQRYAEGKIAGASAEEEQEAMDTDNRRVLRIKRMIHGTWKTEIVRDPAVIRAYVKGRLALEEENTATNTLKPTGDAEKDERAYKRLQEEIARMKKNQERRLHRKNAKIAAEGGTLLQLNRPIKPDTTRHCGHCGQMGHMKTNRKCPRWHEFNGPNAQAAKAKGASPAPATPGAPVLSFSRGGMPPPTMPVSGSGPSAASPAGIMSPPATIPPSIIAAPPTEGSSAPGTPTAPSKLKFKLPTKPT